MLTESKQEERGGVNKMTDTNKLRQFMDAKGYTVRRLAAVIGISHEAMYQKLSNERGFKASEIMNIADALGLSRSERDSVFFCR